MPFGVPQDLIINTTATGNDTFNTSELMVVADDLDDDDFHFLFRSELLPGVLPEPNEEVLVILLLL